MCRSPVHGRLGAVDPAEPPPRLANARSPEGAARAPWAVLPRVPQNLARPAEVVQRAPTPASDRVPTGYRRDVRQDDDLSEIAHDRCAGARNAQPGRCTQGCSRCGRDPRLAERLRQTQHRLFGYRNRRPSPQSGRAAGVRHHHPRGNRGCVLQLGSFAA